jgi:hypothetical protein
MENENAFHLITVSRGLELLHFLETSSVLNYYTFRNIMS